MLADRREEAVTFEVRRTSCVRVVQEVTEHLDWASLHKEPDQIGPHSRTGRRPRVSMRARADQRAAVKQASQTPQGELRFADVDGAGLGRRAVEQLS